MPQLESCPQLPQLEKARMQQRRPRAAKNNYLRKKQNRLHKYLIKSE